MICLTLTGNTMTENRPLIEKNRDLINLVELRLDFLSEENLRDLKALKESLGIPAIAAFRRKKDGGRYEGDETYRLKKLFDAVAAGFEYVDIENDLNVPEIEEKAQKYGTKIIKSFHNFDGVPDNLESIIRSSYIRGKVIPKVSVYPKNSADVLKLIRVIRATEGIKEKIILGMGEYGFFTRILYRTLGSFLTFCSAGDREGAPGHISPGELQEVYNMDIISSETAVYGIIGNPVMHSKSPALHNRGYRKCGLDAVYVPFPVDDVALFFELVRMLSIRGFSVTVPHKTEVLQFLDSKDATVIEAGACNTVVVTGNVFKGWNTDLEGFCKPLEKRVSLSEIKKIAVIGAGGAAGAVVKSLKKLNAEIHIFNRTEKNAEILADRFGVSHHSLDRYDIIGECDLIVQTTSVGMSPDILRTPLPGYRFSKDQIVYDLIYTPPATSLLKKAKEAGCVTINGQEMLITQGERQFELFTGYCYPDTGA